MDHPLHLDATHVRPVELEEPGLILELPAERCLLVELLDQRVPSTAQPPRASNSRSLVRNRCIAACMYAAMLARASPIERSSVDWEAGGKASGETATIPLVYEHTSSVSIGEHHARIRADASHT